MKKNKQTNIVFTTTPLMIGEPIHLNNPARGAKTIEDLIPVLPTKKPKDYFFFILRFHRKISILKIWKLNLRRHGMSTNIDMVKSIFGEVFEWIADYYWSIDKTPEHSFDEIKDAYNAAEKEFNNSGIDKDVITVYYLSELEQMFKIIANQDEERRAIDQIRILTSHKN